MGWWGESGRTEERDLVEEQPAIWKSPPPPVPLKSVAALHWRGRMAGGGASREPPVSWGLGSRWRIRRTKDWNPSSVDRAGGNNIYEERSVNTDEWSFTVATCLVSLCKCDHTQINDPKCSVTSVPRIVDPCTHWCSTDAEKYGHGLKIHSVKQSLCQGLTQGTSSKFKVWCVVHVCTGTQSSCVNDERNMLFGAYCNIFALESSDAGQWLRWRFKSHARLPTKVIPQF